MSLVNIKINGMPLQVEAGISVLEAARQLNIEIPTLCYLKDINAIGACRICVVEVKGQRNLPAACVTPVYEGMEILTNSKRVFEARRMNLELILSTHKKNVFHVSVPATVNSRKCVKTSESTMKITMKAKS